MTPTAPFVLVPEEATTEMAVAGLETFIAGLPDDPLPPDAPENAFRRGLIVGASLGRSSTEMAAIYKAMLAAAPAAPPAPSQQWADISSAPKDAEIILWSPYSTGPLQGRWIAAGDAWEPLRRTPLPEGWYWAGYNGAVGPIEPSHWHPLPSPPEGQ